jgi:hypothetical protein
MWIEQDPLLPFLPLSIVLCLLSSGRCSQLYMSRAAPLIFPRWHSHQRVLVDRSPRDEFTENDDDFTKPHSLTGSVSNAEG